jgi:CBS domain-containing protein
LEDIPITDIERKRDNNAVNIQVSMEELFEKVTNQNFVPVVDDNNVFIGIITRKDIILYLANKDNAN